MKGKFLYAIMASLILTGTWLTSCSDDDDDTPIGNAVITIENVSTVKDFVQSGTFQMEGTQPIIMPGQSVSFKFHAGKGQALMFATMYGYSNDVFFAPENAGIFLFNADGTPVTGDVSSSVKLWDNGTRINQVPGTEVEHPGEAEIGNVKMIKDKDAQGNTYPEASELMKVTLAYTAQTSEFTMTISNVSDNKVNETPFSPGVWVVSNRVNNDLVNGKPFFDADKKSSDALTALAENGNNKPLADWAKSKTGIMTGLSPAVVVVYTGDVNPLFEVGKKDAGMGLKELAQKGDVTKLKESLMKMNNVREVYVLGKDPIAPGEKEESPFIAFDGDNIAFVTMFGYSNDWFYGNNAKIGSLTKGDVTNKISLYDNGTAVNQYPGAGNAQALFGGTPIAEDNNISVVGNTYPVPAVSEVIKITLR